MSIDDVKYTLRNGLQHSSDARATIVAAHDRIRSALAATQATTEGATNQTAMGALERLKEAERQATLLVRRLDAADDAVGEYVRLLG